MNYRAFVLFSTLLGAAGCNGTPVSPSEIVGIQWELATMQEIGRPAVAVTEPARYRVEFRDNGRIAVRADCNACVGQYSLDSPRLHIGELACTRVACPSDSLDDRYLGALEAATTVGFEDGALTIRGGAGALKFAN
jgi:heat shock protein HslJ